MVTETHRWRVILQDMTIVGDGGEVCVSGSQSYAGWEWHPYTSHFNCRFESTSGLSSLSSEVFQAFRRSVKYRI